MVWPLTFEVMLTIGPEHCLIIRGLYMSGLLERASSVMMGVLSILSCE